MAQLSAFEQWWVNGWPHRLHVRRSIPRFLQACPEPFRGQVLEVGAGNGWSSRTILETFPQVELTATDSNPDMVSRFTRLQEQYGRRLRVQTAAVEKLPFDRASFDVVVALYVMHHVDDVAAALAQCMRVLRPGGLLGIVDENQLYVVGPLKKLWRAGNSLPRAEVVQLVTGEATILAQAGDADYYLWAQKAYPF